MPSISEINLPIESELYHHGILGMKWGVRRYQNYDGSLTDEGRDHYSVSDSIKRATKDANSFISGLSGKSLNDIKVDMLDYANRKGVLDFLDSKADEPFSSIRESGSRYVSESAKDAFRAMSNVNRYMDIRGLDKSTDQKTFMNAMNSYTNKQGYKSWVDGLLAKEGQSVTDKKLGMISKEARDIERETRAKMFVDDLAKDKWDVGKLTERWYKTDRWGNKEQFQGQSANYEKKLIEVPNYVEEVTPAHTKTSYTRYYKMPGDTREGLKGVQMGKYYDLDTTYKFNKEGYVDIPHKVDVPETRQTVRKGWRTEEQLIYTGDTKEYRDFMKGLNMPSDYSHLVNEQTKINTGSSFIEEYLAMRHSELFDYSDILVHYGTKGQKWHNRKYQYPDGSLTPLGRIHYGVGPAREKLGAAAGSVKSAAGKAGEAVKKTAANAGDKVRKAVKPTDQELVEKYEKLRVKKAREDLKQEIRELEGHKKKIKDMSDQEVMDAINRHKNEATLKALQKDANKSEARKLIEKAAREGVSQAVRGTALNVGANIGSNIANLFDTKENKLSRKAQMARDKKAAEDLSDEEANRLSREAQKARDRKTIEDADKPKSESDRIREYAEASKNSKSAYEAQLQEAALRGDEDAKQKLSDFKKATKGDYKKDEPNVIIDDDDSVTYEAPKKSNSKNDSSVSDVFKNAANDVYESVIEDADFEVVYDSPGSAAYDYLKKQTTKALPPGIG